MADRKSHSQAPADHRRKWDSVEYEKVAKAREDVEKAINRDRSRDLKEDPVKRELLKIRDYKGELHKDVNSYLLSIGSNEKIAANIDPNSSIGQRMHELLEREHQYNIEKNLAVDQRSSYCITKEIKENYLLSKSMWYFKIVCILFA